MFAMMHRIDVSAVVSLWQKKVASIRWPRFRDMFGNMYSSITMQPGTSYVLVMVCILFIGLVVLLNLVQ